MTNQNSQLPKDFLTPFPRYKGSNKEPKKVGHSDKWNWLGSIANSESVKVLEIGSRAVSSDSHWKRVAPNCNYVGFDYIDGKNVDVVGDAHRLSDYFEDEYFDIVISSAVFEHLAMPWIVVEEISKVLKVGGSVVTETHFSFCEHEMPWNFFQFHCEGLKYLFNPKLGFETVDAGFSNPMVAWFSDEADSYLIGKRINNIYCHANLLARKNKTVLTSESLAFDWRSTIDNLQESSSYPSETGLSSKK